MTNLVEAFDKATVVLKQTMAEGKQRGGECGLYSLWYASLLLSFINKDGRQIIYPRKSYAPQQQPGSRSFAKTLGSGQGEILNWKEMDALVTHFGYHCGVVRNWDTVRRAEFIDQCLNANRPVLYPYLEGGNPGSSCEPIAAKDNNCGPHWALLIASQGNTYGIIDPHWPNTIRYYGKQLILESNLHGDDDITRPVWNKSEFNDPAFGDSKQVKPGSREDKEYKLGDTKARHGLNAVLVSVY